MRGHLWLGFLSFPLILFHGGFHFGGPLTRTLMWLFVFVFASGIVGAALQHFMPRIHTTQLPMETIYEQIDRVRGQLAEEAARLVEEACSALEGEVSHASELQRAASASAGTMGGLTVASGLQADEAGQHTTKAFPERANCSPTWNRAGAGKMSLSNAGAGADHVPAAARAAATEPAFKCGRSGKHLRGEAPIGPAEPPAQGSCTVGCWSTFRCPMHCCSWERFTRVMALKF